MRDLETSPDIIKSAQQLLDGATPAPWEVDIDGLEVYSTVDGDAVAHAQTPSDADLIAAAPELAQALAEETYFYGVQVWMGGRWIMMLTRDHGTSLMHRGKWFERKDEAEECAAKWNHDTPTRIVRRRVSPPEVING